MMYSFYFVSHNLFGGRFKKNYIYESNGILEKLNNYYKILKNKKKYKHLIFSGFLLDSKSNQTLETITFSDIQIARYHISRNLDVIGFSRTKHCLRK